MVEADIRDKDGSTPPSTPAGGVRLTLLIILLAFLLYAFTAAPDVQWQDRGAFALRVLLNQPENQYGLALVHPVQFHLARLLYVAGIADPPLAASLVSAFGGAVAVGLVFACIITLTGRVSAALFGSLSLAVASTFWQMSTAAEVYSVTAALLAAEWLVLLQFLLHGKTRSFQLACLFNGIGISNHLLALLTTPVIAIVGMVSWRKKRLPARNILFGALLWLLGVSIYGYYVVAHYLREGDLAGTIKSALFGESFADDVLNVSITARLLLISIAFVLLNFPNLLLPLAARGLATLRHHSPNRPAVMALAAGLVIHALFVVRYPVVDQYTFYLPTYVFLAILGGLGFSRFFGREGTSRGARAVCWGLLVLTPVFYLLVPALGRRVDLLAGAGHNKPYRDDYIFLFMPWSCADKSAAIMSRQAVDMAGEGGIVVFEDHMAQFALRYEAAHRGRSDVSVVKELSPAMLREAVDRQRKIVLVPRDRDDPVTPPGIGEWAREGDLYEWTPRYHRSE